MSLILKSSELDETKLPLRTPLPFCTNHNVGRMHRHSVSPHGKSLVLDFCLDRLSVLLE